MLKKTLIAAIAAAAMMAGAQAPANAAMKISPPTAATGAADINIVEVRGGGRGFRGGGRGFRRGGGRFRRFRNGRRFRHGRFGHRRWHHRRWRWRHRGWRHRGHRYHGRWSSYRSCMWKQSQGYRIYCPKPYRY